MADKTKMVEINLTGGSEQGERILTPPEQAAFLKAKGWKKMPMHEAPTPIFRWLDPTKPMGPSDKHVEREIEPKGRGRFDENNRVWVPMMVKQWVHTPRQHPLSLEDAYDLQCERDAGTA